MSKAQQLYRIFTKQINDLIRSIQSAVEQGETYSIEDVSEWFNEIMEDFQQDLPDTVSNPDLWYQRSQDFVNDKLDKIANILGEPEDEDGEPLDEEFLDEFPEISEEQCRAETPGLPGDGVGIPRNVILLTHEEVLEYSKGLPFELIKGFIPIYNNQGDLKGWKPCILKDTW